MKKGMIEKYSLFAYDKLKYCLHVAPNTHNYAIINTMQQSARIAKDDNDGDTSGYITALLA